MQDLSHQPYHVGVVVIAAGERYRSRLKGLGDYGVGAQHLCIGFRALGFRVLGF